MARTVRCAGLSKRQRVGDFGGAGGGTLSECPWADCWCRRWPPLRMVVSAGLFYDVEALPHLGEPWLFRYVYREAA